MHGHPFDAKHQFKVNRLTDIERYENLDENYVEPKIEKYTPRVRPLRLATVALLKEPA